MKEKAISQHKKMAMGEKVGKKAVGGMVTPRIPKTSMPGIGGGALGGASPISSVRTKIPGMPMNPVTREKMNNGIPGMKKGGKSTAKKKGGKC